MVITPPKPNIAITSTPITIQQPISLQQPISIQQPISLQQPLSLQQFQHPTTTTIVKKIVTPRNPTADEKSSRVMIYKVSNGVFKYICLICGVVTTEKTTIKSHMDNHNQAQRSVPEITNKKIILVSSDSNKSGRPIRIQQSALSQPISIHQQTIPSQSLSSIVIAPNVSITPIKKPITTTVTSTALNARPMVSLMSGNKTINVPKFLEI